MGHLYINLLLLLDYSVDTYPISYYAATLSTGFLHRQPAINTWHPNTLASFHILISSTTIFNSSLKSLFHIPRIQLLSPFPITLKIQSDIYCEILEAKWTFLDFFSKRQAICNPYFFLSLSRPKILLHFSLNNL